MSRLLVALALAGVLWGCSGFGPARPTTAGATAIVTSIADGRAGFPNEKMVGLRTPGGRVHFVTQSFSPPVHLGDLVEIELAKDGSVRVRAR